jgi:hypothetical protein
MTKRTTASLAQLVLKLLLWLPESATGVQAEEYNLTTVKMIALIVQWVGTPRRQPPFQRYAGHVQRATFERRSTR